VNERIKELMNQAAKQYYADTGEIKPNDMMYIFAELIVRECAKVLDAKLANPDGWCDGSDLLEHFGVKE
jgi:hypothetical protein